MKFLVISRPNGHQHDLGKNVSAKNYAAEITKLHESKVLEVSYAFIGGGSAYVVNADTAKQLAVLVRSNPLFNTQNHEIVPIADANDFLEAYDDYVG